MTRRAILSVYDKTGLADFGRRLASQGFELVASGGSARLLREAGLAVVDVSDVTKHPEILGGRVKTLHPAIHGGILARRTEDHAAELASHGIGAVDLVVCNLYPFVDTVRGNVTELQAIEQIDIGGVTLLRAAAKNFEAVAIVCDPADYDTVADQFEAGEVGLVERRRLALKAFRQTATYDAAISSWLAAKVEPERRLPTTLTLVAEAAETLRYGENPHQAAVHYRWAGTKPMFEQLQGKSLSYNNLVDLDAAWQMPNEFDKPCVAIIKHTNPCGLAIGDNLIDAFDRAFACDTVSAFGSIITVNREIDADFVRNLKKLFVEVLAAPSFTAEALQVLARRKKNCRVMLARSARDMGNPGPLHPGDIALKGIGDGLLAMSADRAGTDRSNWRVVTERQPSDAEMEELAFAWIAAKHVKSNAILFTRGNATVGVGAGQMNRVDSVRLAARQAGEKAIGAVLASDAFFPFPDGIEAAAESGIKAVIQPGGSIRDDVVIEAANKLGLAMVLTGERHFRH